MDCSISASHPSSDGWSPIRVPGDDDDLARRMLDGLLGGRPEAILRLGDALCLTTPRGLEIIDLPAYRRRPRIDLGARLLGAATLGQRLALMDETGRIALWDGGQRLRDLLPPSAATSRCRQMTGASGTLVLGCGARVETVDARSGAVTSRGDVDQPGRTTALALGSGGAVLVARSQAVLLLDPAEGGSLVTRGSCTLGPGEVLALAETTIEPGSDPVTVAFDELGWLTVIHRHRDTLEVRGRIELEIDGGAPERAGLFCDGPMVMVASGTRLLHQVDLRPLPGDQDPILMATVSAGTGVADVIADRDRVYLADAFRGLVVLDRRQFEICHDDPVVARVAINEPP